MVSWERTPHPRVKRSDNPPLSHRTFTHGSSAPPPSSTVGISLSLSLKEHPQARTAHLPPSGYRSALLGPPALLTWPPLSTLWQRDPLKQA